MSCERQSGRVASKAAVKAGIGAIANKAGAIVGTLGAKFNARLASVVQAGQTRGQALLAPAQQKAGAAIEQWAEGQDRLNEQVLGRVAPLSNAALRRLDRPAVTAAKAAPYLAGALAGLRLRGYLLTRSDRAPVAAVAVAPRSLGEIMRHRRALGQARRAVATAGAVSALSASVAVWATKEEGQTRTLTRRKNEKVQADVTFQKAARMTNLLNRLDLIGSHRLGHNVVSSGGDIVQASPGGTWHRGTSTVQTPRGERTVTHLQSLKLPAHHYYFDRKLSDEEVAGLVTGREKADRLPGYGGEVHPLESLMPSWGATKKAMITTRLYHPPAEADWVATEKKS